MSVIERLNLANEAQQQILTFLGRASANQRTIREKSQEEAKTLREYTAAVAGNLGSFGIFAEDFSTIGGRIKLAVRYADAFEERISRDGIISALKGALREDLGPELGAAAFQLGMVAFNNAITFQALAYPLGQILPSLIGPDGAATIRLYEPMLRAEHVDWTAMGATHRDWTQKHCGTFASDENKVACAALNASVRATFGDTFPTDEESWDRLGILTRLAAHAGPRASDINALGEAMQKFFIMVFDREK